MSLETHTSSDGERRTSGRARQIIDGLAQGFLSVDGDWRMTECNALAERYLGLKQRDLVGRSLWDVAGFSEESPFAALARRVAATGQGQEAELEHRRNGRRALLAVRMFPLDGGVAAVWRDITSARAAERRLARSEARYRELAHGAPAAAWLSRADGKLEFINQAMVDTLGRPKEALLGHGWMDAIDPEDRDGLLAVRAQARAHHSIFSYEGRFRDAGGRLRIVQLYGRPRFGADGAFRGHVGAAVDVTMAREVERRRQLLINELNHRVKNTLAIVQSLVRQTLRDQHVGKEVESLLSDRLVGLAAAYDVLTREDWEGAELRAVVEEAARPYDHDKRIVMEGPSARLAPKSAITLSMALHELVTNAVKYGALSTDDGRVDLKWSTTGKSALLEWRERGGPAVRPPERSGFGSRLLGRILAVELGAPAELDYAPSGMSCRISAPLL